MFNLKRLYLLPEETGGNELEVAEPIVAEETVETNEPTETTEEKEVSTVDMSMEEVIELQKQKAEKQKETSENEKKQAQTKEENAKYAAARRDAEKKYNDEIKKRDEAIARRYQGVVNPLTGKPITNQDELFEAQDAQREVEAQRASELARQQLQKSGVDMGVVNQLIQNSPEMQKLRQTQAQMEQFQEQQNQKTVDEQVQASLKEIAKYDSSVKTLDDIGNLDKAQDIVKSVQSGMSLEQAYRIAYFDKIVEQKATQAKQGAINQVKAKAHLQTTKSIIGGGEDVHVPESTMSILRDMPEYENLSDAEIRKKAAQFIQD